MQIKETGIEGLIEIIPTVYNDHRGWFYEFFNEDALKKEAGITTDFVQDNRSFSYKGVIRGLHLQLPPFSQAKLISVVMGKILDVVVDLREESKTFGEVYYCELDGETKNMLYVPEGFAHGFAALEETLFFYKCSSYYSKAHETGIRWNDPDLKMQWPDFKEPKISEKDAKLPTLNELLRNSVISQQ